MSFYERNEEDLKSELAAVIKESTRLCQLFDDVRAEVVELQSCLSTEKAVI